MSCLNMTASEQQVVVGYISAFRSEVSVVEKSSDACPAMEDSPCVTVREMLKSERFKKVIEKAKKDRKKKEDEAKEKEEEKEKDQCEKTEHKDEEKCKDKNDDDHKDKDKDDQDDDDDDDDDDDLAKILGPSLGVPIPLGLFGAFAAIFHKHPVPPAYFNEIVKQFAMNIKGKNPVTKFRKVTDSLSNFVTKNKPTAPVNPPPVPPPAPPPVPPPVPPPPPPGPPPGPPSDTKPPAENKPPKDNPPEEENNKPKDDNQQEEEDPEDEQQEEEGAWIQSPSASSLHQELRRSEPLPVPVLGNAFHIGDSLPGPAPGSSPNRVRTPRSLHPLFADHRRRAGKADCQDDLKKKIDELKQRDNQLKKAREELEKLRSGEGPSDPVKRLQNRVNSLERALDRANDRGREYKNRKDELKRQLEDQVKESESKNKEWEDRVKQCDDTLEKLRDGKPEDPADDLGKGKGKPGEGSGQCTKCENTLKDAQQRIEDLEAQPDNSNGPQLRKELKTVQEALQDCHDNLQDSEKDLSKANKRIRQLEKSKPDGKGKGKPEDPDSGNKQLQKCQTDLKQAEATLSKHAQERQRLEDQAQKDRSKITELEERLKNSEGDSEDPNHQDLEKELQDTKDELKAANEQIGNLKKNQMTREFGEKIKKLVDVKNACEQREQALQKKLDSAHDCSDCTEPVVQKTHDLQAKNMELAKAHAKCNTELAQERGQVKSQQKVIKDLLAKVNVPTGSDASDALRDCIKKQNQGTQTDRVAA